GIGRLREREGGEQEKGSGEQMAFHEWVLGNKWRYQRLAIGFWASRSSSASSLSGALAICGGTRVPSGARSVGVPEMPIWRASSVLSATGLAQVALPVSAPLIAAVNAALRSLAHHTASAFLSAPGWISSGRKTYS